EGPIEGRIRQRADRRGEEGPTIVRAQARHLAAHRPHPTARDDAPGSAGRAATSAKRADDAVARREASARACGTADGADERGEGGADEARRPEAARPAPEGGPRGQAGRAGGLGAALP